MLRIMRDARSARRCSFHPVLEFLEDRTLLSSGIWTNYAGDPQHTAISQVQSQPIRGIRWQTPVDLNPQHVPPPDGELLIHYGSPLVTPANTILIPVKTGATDGFEVTARNGATGALKYTLTTDYTLSGMPFHWTPSYSPTLTPNGRLYYAGAGGTLYYIDNLDSNNTHTPVQVAFYGISNYQANPGAFKSTVFIDTPLTSDKNGDIFFGFRVVNTAPAPLNTTQSGYARVDPNGNGIYVLAGDAAGDAKIASDSHNLAPALSNDQSTVYVAVKQADTAYYGYLLGLDSTTLATKGKVFLNDPRPLAGGGSNPAGILDDSTSSPTVGPDGDVYFGVFGQPYNGSRGWLLHFSSDLSVEKIPGAFGWDDTVAIVPRSMVPSYQGSSSYLLFSKYNNYAGTTDGGDGVNKIAILDPNATETESHPSSNGLLVMNEVMTIAGVTPDQDFRNQGFPNAVREWCINTAAVDPATHSVLANSEDGKLYRWDLTTNRFSNQITLTKGIGEAYTPTLIGADGTIYAINNATLFAIGSLSTKTSVVSSSMNPSDFGQQVTFTATVTPVTPTSLVPKGTITFAEGSTALATVAIDGSGQAHFSTASLRAGDHLLKAFYSGDSVFDKSASPSPFTQTVGPSATTTSLKSSVNPSVFGQPVKFTAMVHAMAGIAGTPTGNVTFKDNGVAIGTGSLVNGTAFFTTIGLGVGNHTITAAYTTTNNFKGSTSGPWGQTVSRASTVTGISSSTNPSLFGEPVTFIATVFIKAPGGGTPLGTVTFFDGTTILATSGLNIHNEAFFSTASLAAGNHPITAVYSGDIHFLGSTSFIEVQKVIPHISNGIAAVSQLAGVQATGALPVNETIVVTTPANTIDRDAAWRAAHLDEVFAAAHSVPHREVRRNAHLRTASVGDDWLEV